MLTYELQCCKYLSLYRHIRNDILSGKLKAGEKLPSKRTLAENLSVSVITVQTAYEQLLAEGYIRSEPRSGYFVEDVNVQFYGEKTAALPERAEQKKFTADFVHGAPPAELFPFSVWARLMRGVLSDCGAHLLERVPCDGDPELKSAVAGYLYRARGIDVDPRLVVIGAGAEYLYGVIVQLLGRDKIFALENPGYNKIYNTYKLNGAECRFVNVGANGVDPEELEKTGADVLHFSPSHQFPTGAVTPMGSRAKIINWARARGAYVIEDDYDSEFRLSGKPLQCAFGLGADRVIYMNTFSKSLAPSMRLGYMVLPAALYEKYLSLFGSSACVVPLFEQKTLAKLIDGGYFERHLNRLKNYYRGVRQTLCERAGKFKGVTLEDSGSGLHMIANIPSLTDGEIKRLAAARGINVKCVSDYLFAPVEGAGGKAVLNYSGVTAEQINRI